MTEIMTSKMATPRATPRSAAPEIIEKKFLKGLRYLKARVELKDLLMMTIMGYGLLKVTLFIIGNKRKLLKEEFISKDAFIIFFTTSCAS